jgi:hypothetical protein
MLFVLATCLAGFDEILTLQWGASLTGRPFHLVDLSTPEAERLPDISNNADSVKLFLSALLSFHLKEFFSFVFFSCSFFSASTTTARL